MRVVIPLFVALLFAGGVASIPAKASPLSAQKTVRTHVQLRPGGPVKDVDMPVHAAPVDPPSVPADSVVLDDNDLVLGVVVGGRAMAYPVRFLALHEIVNDVVAGTPLTPTW